MAKTDTPSLDLATLRAIPAGVWTLGLVSLLMDVSSEMIHALLPVYLVTVLGISTLAVGVIEGIAEATAAIVKVFSGALSDWLGRRKMLAAAGYALAAFTKPVFPLASEGGHASFAVEDALEFAMLERLLTGREHLSVERVVSGPGLADVYRVLAELQGQPAPPLLAADVMNRALAEEDPIAQETLEHFATWLGRFAGDTALFFAARGGVYLGGGIAPRMVNVLSAGAFRRAFEAKGRMASYLIPVPVCVILSGEAVLKGAAAALAARVADL